ncbi:uncharacterized protein LOC124134664 [Haliotis rufescens]|uniref:uncharacterized protein LOC124134664 n=1 Tax=Haliotis rufescens TaxID=6454 RepID=UPI00201EDE09|nr:uncharacterized protein LOC124134664 [Haliotis rufescens]
MSGEFRPTSHHESGEEIFPIHDEQETLHSNKPTEHESIHETMSTTDSYASIDHRSPGFVEYHHIDDVNPASAYQQVTEERQSEADNDYECIAETYPAYDYLEAINDSRTLTSRNSAVAKCKKSIVFLAPIFASVTVNIIAGFFFRTFFLTVAHITSNRAGSEDGGMLLNLFCLFSALAAASCAPLLIRYGFRKVALGGSVLHIFSCISSSLTTTGHVMTISFSIMGGFTVGLLRTIGVVATVDHLNSRPALALIISYTSFIIGNVIRIIFSSFDLIQYQYNRRGGSDTSRLFEIIAVTGLVAGRFLQKNSQTQQNMPQLFKHPPFYFLISIRVVASMGLSILLPSIKIIRSEESSILSAVLFVSQFIVLIVLLILRNFQKESLKESALLLMGISVLAVGLVTMFHQATFGSFWVGFSFVIGAVIVFSQVMIPLVMVHTTGRTNLKLTLPVLCCFDQMGGLIGSSIMEKIVTETSSVNGTLYFAGLSLTTAGIGAIIAWVLIMHWRPLSHEAVSRHFVLGADNTGDEEAQDPDEEEAEDNVGNFVEEAADDAGGEKAGDPGDEETKDPGDEETKDPDDEEAADPGDEEAGNPGYEEAGNPGDEETKDPGDEEAADPGDEAGNPGDEEAGNPGDEETKDPGDEETKDPGDEETKDAGD